MRALRKTAPRPGAELQDVPVPDPGEGEVLVRVHAASICGTAASSASCGGTPERSDDSIVDFMIV